MLKPKTYTVLVLDRSSSMLSIRDEAVAGFNEQVELFKEQSKDHRLRVGLVTFASEVDKPTIWNKMPSAIKPLTTNDYMPNGMTAFYDALNTTIDSLMEIQDIKEGKASVLVVAITDGHENNSETKGPELSAKIKELEGGGNWTFTVMGANINLAELSDKLGISVHNTMQFDATPEGMVMSTNAHSHSLNKYFEARTRGVTRIDGFYNSHDHKEGDVTYANSSVTISPDVLKGAISETTSTSKTV